MKLRFAKYVCLCGLAAMMLSLRLPAQGVEVSAGASTLLGADGVTLTHYMGDRESIVSVGRNGAGLVMGGATEFHRANGWTRYGDTAMSFALPTDLDGAVRGVGARGVDWKQTTQGGTFHVFAGKTGNPLGFGYLRAVDPQRWSASLEWMRAWGPRLRLQALGAVGAAHAGLVAAQYQLGPRAEVSATAGWNAGHPVLVLAAKVGGASWAIHGSETVGRLQLRPETALVGAADQAHVPERAGTNVSLSKRLGSAITVDASRVEYGRDLQAALPDGAVLHEAGVTAHRGAWAGGVRGFASHDGPNAAKGLAGLASWTYGPWRLETSVAESWRMGSAATYSVLGQASYDVAGTVRLSGGVDWEGSGPGLVAGGEVHRGWGSVRVSERVVYVPFGPSAGFTKVTELALRMHPRGVETSVETLVGKGVPWSYSVLGEGFVSTPGTQESAAPASVRTRTVLPKYVVRGWVVDAEGAPVAAAAVRVAEETVWTNSDGLWEARQRRGGAVRVAFAPEASLSGVRWVPVGAGSVWALAAEESAAEPVKFVVAPCRAACAGTAVETPLSAGATSAEELEPTVSRPAGEDSPDAVTLVRRGIQKMLPSLADILRLAAH